jgi:hypothetical protein
VFPLTGVGGIAGRGNALTPTRLNHPRLMFPSACLCSCITRTHTVTATICRSSAQRRKARSGKPGSAGPCGPGGDPWRWSAQTPGSDGRRRGQSVMRARRLAEALFMGKDPGRSDHRPLGWGLVSSPRTRRLVQWPPAMGKGWCGSRMVRQPWWLLLRRNTAPLDREATDRRRSW